MNLGKYYIASALFSASRMGIGATTVIYMLSKGVSLGDVAIIKIVQAVVIFFTEVPSGIVADKWGRKLSIQISCICAIFGFLSFILVPNFIGFSIAEVFNALTISFWSGAFESLAVDNTKADKRESGFIQYFFHKINKYGALAIMMAGLIGGWLGESNLIYPFYFSSTLMLISLIFITLKLPELRGKSFASMEKLKISKRLRNTISQMKEDTKNAFRYSFSSDIIRKYFIIQIAVQFAIQPVLHYWQPYFENISDQTNAKSLGLLFFSYVLIQSISSWCLSSLYKKSLVNDKKVTIVTGGISAVSCLILGLSQNLYLSIGAFLILQASISNYRNNIGASFNKYIEAKQRSTILSSVSFISRLGMFLHLGILTFTTQFLALRHSFLFSFIASMVFVYYSFHWESQNKSCKVLANA